MNVCHLPMFWSWISDQICQGTGKWLGNQIITNLALSLIVWVSLFIVFPIMLYGSMYKKTALRCSLFSITGFKKVLCLLCTAWSWFVVWVWWQSCLPYWWAPDKVIGCLHSFLPEDSRCLILRGRTVEIIFETSGEERNFNFFLNFSFVCLWKHRGTWKGVHLLTWVPNLRRT